MGKLKEKLKTCLVCNKMFSEKTKHDVCNECWEKVFIKHDVEDFLFDLASLISFKKVATDPTSPRNGWQ